MAELEELLAAAHRPWSVPEEDRSSVRDPSGRVVANCTIGEAGEGDAALIAAAVNELPTLLAAVGRGEGVSRTINCLLTTQLVECGDHAQDEVQALEVDPGMTVGDLVRATLYQADWQGENPRPDPKRYLTIRVAVPR